MIARDINVTMRSGKTAKKTVYEKQVVFWAKKYADKARAERGELVKKAMALLAEDENYDGYYAIVTSELEMSEKQIIDTYRGLWEIEETFKVTKGTLEARPVYVSREDRIGAHFLICFISLMIIRLIQKTTNRRFSAEKIVFCLNNITCSNEQDNLYLFNYRSEIKTILAESKK